MEDVRNQGINGRQYRKRYDGGLPTAERFSSIGLHNPFSWMGRLHDKNSLPSAIQAGRQHANTRLFVQPPSHFMLTVFVSPVTRCYLIGNNGVTCSMERGRSSYQVALLFE